MATFPCYNHPETPAVVLMDWYEDGVELCAECIVPWLTKMSTLDVPLQANCGAAVVHLSLIDDDA